jgi:hypothetical protein
MTRHGGQRRPVAAQSRLEHPAIALALPQRRAGGFIDAAAEWNRVLRADHCYWRYVELLESNKYYAGCHFICK